MRRPLNKQEKELEQQGLDRNKKELAMIENQLQYNLDLLAKQKYIQDLEDKWRPFIRETTNFENEKTIKDIRENISLKKTNITIAERHLKDGVEVRNNQTA